MFRDAQYISKTKNVEMYVFMIIDEYSTHKTVDIMANEMMNYMIQAFRN